MVPDPFLNHAATSTGAWDEARFADRPARHGRAICFSATFALPLNSALPTKPAKPRSTSSCAVSRKLIDELTTKKFSRVDPIHLYIIDTPIDGVALTDATFRVQFDTSAKESAFTLHLEGTTRGSTVGSRSRVQVLGSSQLDFVVRKRVTFDGLKYRGDPTQVSARFHPTVDSIVTPRGLIGLVLRHYAASRDSPAATAGRRDWLRQRQRQAHRAL